MILLFCILAVGFGIIWYLQKNYTIRTVYVEGNVHYTQEEIQNIVMSGLFGNNSLYLAFKYQNKGVQNIPFVDIMDVSILSPDTIKIKVYEKALAGYVKYLDTFMYFDKDGCVVECSNMKTVGIPEIAGLNFEYMVLGEVLPVEDTDIFSSIMSITRLLDKYELTADKIYFYDSKSVTIYFGEIKAALGNNNREIEDKIMLLPELLKKVEGKKGTFRMESFNDTNTNVSFEPDSE